MKTVLAALLLPVLLSSAAWGGDARMEKRLEVLERRVSHISDLVLEVEGLKRTNRELLGRVEELEHRLERLQQKQRALYRDLDERIVLLQEGGSRPAAVPPASGGGTPASGEGGTEPPGPVVAGAPTGSVSQPAVATTATPEQIQAEYEAAYRLLQPSQRKYKAAIAAFEQFLERHPHSDLADNALYWLGETHYVTGNNAEALEAFDRLLDGFPDSDKRPGALLKKGYILDALGRDREAVEVLRTLVRRYPQASVARVARTRLEKLGAAP